MLKCLFAKGKTWLCTKDFKWINLLMNSYRRTFEVGWTKARQFKGVCLISVEGLFNGKTDKLWSDYGPCPKAYFVLFLCPRTNRICCPRQRHRKHSSGSIETVFRHSAVSSQTSRVKGRSGLHKCASCSIQLSHQALLTQQLYSATPFYITLIQITHALQSHFLIIMCSERYASLFHITFSIVWQNPSVNVSTVLWHPSGADLLKLTREDVIQICGPADGIRLFNALKGR